jgi:putative aldouronate transport system substrate-binding protein
MMIWFASLWDEGLLDPEMFTQDRTLWSANGMNDLIGVTTGYGPGDWSETFEYIREDGFTGTKTHWQPLPVLRADPDAEPVWRRNSYQVGTNMDGFPVGATIFRNQMIITDNAEDPALIMRYFNHIYALRESVQTHWGPIGVRLDELGPREFKAIPRELISDDVLEATDWGRLYVQSLPRFAPPGFEQVRDADSVLGMTDQGERDLLYEPFLTPLAPRAWLLEEDITEVAQITTDLITLYMPEFIASVTTGLIDIRDDAVWEKHLNDVEALGASRLVQLINNAVSR